MSKNINVSVIFTTIFYHEYFILDTKTLHHHLSAISSHEKVQVVAAATIHLFQDGSLNGRNRNWWRRYCPVKTICRSPIASCTVHTFTYLCTMAHNAFRSRTIMVGRAGVDAAYRSLMRIMNTEGLSRHIQLKRRHEKPTVKRRRLVYESAQRLYNNEMKNKLAFLFRAQRKETPWSWHLFCQLSYCCTTGFMKLYENHFWWTIRAEI